MNETVVYLPFETNVVAQAFASAAYKQKATFIFTPEKEFSIEGVGDNNDELGHKYVHTGAPQPGKERFEVRVRIQSESGPGWVDSAMVQGRLYTVAGFNVILIASEDPAGDGDWDDCVVMFSWTRVVGSAPSMSEGAEPSE